jgi:hypothetical protein
MIVPEGASDQRIAFALYRGIATRALGIAANKIISVRMDA